MKIDSCVTLVVLTYEGFSDIWEASSFLLAKNWINSSIIIVTDVGDYQNPDSRFLCLQSGKQSNFSDRLLLGAQNVRTKYMVLLLDDYFLTKPIKEDDVVSAVALLEKYGGDYLHFDKMTKAKYTKLEPGLFLNASSGVYAVNTTPSIWKAASLIKCVKVNETAWQHEVNLASRFADNGFKGLRLKHNVLPYLDGIRKGTILPSAYRFLKKSNLYHGNRKLTKKSYLFKLRMLGLIKKTLPKKLVDKLRDSEASKGRPVLRDSCDETKKRIV